MKKLVFMTDLFIITLVLLSVHNVPIGEASSKLQTYPNNIIRLDFNYTILNDTEPITIHVNPLSNFTSVQLFLTDLISSNGEIISAKNSKIIPNNINLSMNHLEPISIYFDLKNKTGTYLGSLYFHFNGTILKQLPISLNIVKDVKQPIGIIFVLLGFILSFFFYLLKFSYDLKRNALDYFSIAQIAQREAISQRRFENGFLLGEEFLRKGNKEFDNNDFKRAKEYYKESFENYVKATPSSEPYDQLNIILEDSRLMMEKKLGLDFSAILNRLSITTIIGLVIILIGFNSAVSISDKLFPHGDFTIFLLINILFGYGIQSGINEAFDWMMKKFE